MTAPAPWTLIAGATSSFTTRSITIHPSAPGSVKASTRSGMLVLSQSGSLESMLIPLPRLVGQTSNTHHHALQYGVWRILRRRQRDVAGNSQLQQGLARVE